MSLVESTQHAPLASAEKSLDKLEIELEESQKKVAAAAVESNGVAGDENADEGELKIPKEQQGEETHLQNGSQSEQETPPTTKIKAGRKPIFNIKLSKILRKSFSEKSDNKEKDKKIEKQTDGGDEDEADDEQKVKEKLLPEGKPEEDEKEESSLVKDQMEVVEVESATNEQDKLSSNKETEKPTNVLLESSAATNNSTTAASSFITSFSTPKWINFRRVFSFNRSTPSSLMMMMSKNGKSENVEPVSLILDIPEDGIRHEQQAKTAEVEISCSEKDLGNTKKSSQSEAEPLETLGDKSENNVDLGATTAGVAGRNSGKNFITPFLQLFHRRTPKSAQEKDVEAGEVGTELLETKSGDEKNGLSGTKHSSSTSEMDQQQTDGEALPKHEHNRLDVEFVGGETKNGSTDDKDKKKTSPVTKSQPTSGSLKSRSDLWRQRLQQRLPRHYKWIFAGTLTLIILVIIISTIAAFRVNKTIDIGSLIIGGKYINTITSCGRIQGISEEGGFAFRGVPFALPPVGELRWKPAQTHQNLQHCWNGTYLAHNHSTPCWQFYRDGSYDGKEDCLYLDLYTPKVFYDTPLPVVVFIGGESLNGGQSSKLKPSAALARQKNVVFITVSIRRSVLGFLTVDLLTAGSYPMTSGNYGLSDLLAALTWVKYNVEHFGGDKNHVTLLGHQSGATLATALMSSPLAKGLFHQVWVSGGSPPSTLINFQEGEIQNAKYLEETYLNCTEITCMQNRGPEQLLQHVPYEWRAFHQDLPTKGEVKHHWLVRDGLILRETLQKNSIFPSQQEYPSDRIPFVSGAPAECDASPEMFSYLDNWNDTSKFSAYLESKLGSFGASLSREVIDRYFRPEATPWQQFVSLLSDVRTICPLYYTTLAMADEFAKNPIYFYVATQRKHTPIGFVADANIDIAAIFGVYEAETREEKKFVQNMEKLFYEFVKKGKFPDELDVTKSIYIVDENIQKTFTYANCDFWQQHNFYPNYSRVD